MAGTTCQVPASALVAALENTERATHLDLRAVMDLEPYWEAVRKVYAPFESGLPAPTGRVYDHEIPGGQLSNLRQQAIALGLGEQFEQIEAMYAAASRILGRPTKVTPSSKVVGDLALHLVAVGADPGRVRGQPAELRHPGLGDRLPRRRAGRPARRLAGAVPDQGAAGSYGAVPRRRALRRGLRRRWTRRGRSARRPSTGCCSPDPTKDFLDTRETYGNVGRLDTLDFLYGLRTGEEHVGADRQGRQPDPRAVGDRRSRRARHAHGDVHDQRPAPADPGPGQVDQGRRQGRRDGPTRSNPGHVAAPFAGVVTVTVAEGDEVEAGATVATIEAMKMEAAITAPIAGDRAAARARLDPAGRRRRPGAGDQALLTD